MPLKKLLFTALVAVSSLMAANKEQATPYDLIRPVWPLTWDESVFDRFDTTVTKKHNMVPKNRTPAAFSPNTFIPDTLNQAYLDNMNVRMSPIRVNQAGYMESDPERQFYYVGTAKDFEIVDMDGKSLSPKVTGTFRSSGASISSDWTIIAGTNAATNDQKRYQVDITGQSGTVQIGNIPQNVPVETRLRVKVGNDISSTFIISDKVYTMVRDAALKFYGINRSGDGDSWFHPASHMKDGAGGVVVNPATSDGARGSYNEALAGTLQGGYYDCGDHLKESLTQMYAFMVAAVMAATNPDADNDHYAFNQSDAQNTDGIPDMLREAKHGADFVLRSFVRAKGVIDDMALSVGTFGTDHGWWGRPENQDYLPTNASAAATDRGGPASRAVRLGEVGSTVGGETAAGLAILGKMYAEYDKPFADSCLMVAKKMYDFAKNLMLKKNSYDGGKPFKNHSDFKFDSEAYNGNNEAYDDLALAAIALHFATYEESGDMSYFNDAVQNKDFSVPQEREGNGFFDGGWMAFTRDGMRKSMKNTSWANAYTYALYALYKLLLKDDETALKYGISTEATKSNSNRTRLWYAENVALILGTNLASESNYNGSTTLEIAIPNLNYTNLNVDGLWYAMQTDQTWIYNRYQMGNIFEVLAYADVTKDLETQVLPQNGSRDWHSGEMHQLAINQLNYMLGVNPWDVSFILGIGDKNDAHPHHRAANPEGKNMPGANYKYNPPVGALFGGVTPGLSNSWVPDNKSWEDYHLSETCIDAAATLVGTGAIAAAKFDRTAAPNVTVEIRHVSMDSAIVMVKLSNRGTATIAYGTAEGSYTLSATDGEKGTQHEIILRGLEKGTTYYFYALGQNAYNESNYTEKYMVDSTKAPYTFTTLNTIESAEINNVTVCNLQGDSAEIMWYTPNGEYESKIYWDTIPHANASEYAFNSGAGNADVSGIPTRFHYVKIGGLKEKTTYYYMVESNGALANVDDDGNRLKFTTPVMWYDFSVRAYQYEFGGMDFLNTNVYNNEARPFDSLTLRLYFTATPDQVEKCATLIDSDICQAYDEAGFNKPCENDRELRDLLRAALPVRLDDTYNPKDGTYSYYFPAPLGSSTIKSQSRLRIDFGFSSGISNDGFKTCETLRQPGKKRFTKNSGDWSWKPHRFQEDGADYDGMPLEDKDYGDVDNEVPINPYIAVYRKDEFIWGYSPSAQEMSHKRAHYEMEVSYDAPFNVPEGSYVQIDQNSSIVHVKGHAYISEGGYITKIWANGNKINALPAIINGERYMVTDNGEIVAHYNSGGEEGADMDSLGLWTLNIPVKMGIGSNKVDITLFAGANPDCAECLENGGCAFVNKTYYVQFTKGNATDGILTVKSPNGTPLSSPAEFKGSGTPFVINLTDKDKSGKGKVNVWVHNNRKQDSLKVTLEEDPQNPGYFSSSTISAQSVSKDARTSTQISFFAGDTITVVYTDPDDEEDHSKVTAFFSLSSKPVPQKVLAMDTNCDNIADKLFIQFSSELSDKYELKEVRVFINGMADTVAIAADPASATSQSEIFMDLPASLGIPENAAPSGKATIVMKAEGVLDNEKVDINDGIAPQLMSVTLLENPDHASERDTIMVSFSEPVQSFNIWPFEVYDASGVEIPQSSISVIGSPTTENNGKSYLFTVTGNTDGKVLPVGAQIKVRTGFQILDENFNLLDPVAICKIVNIAETPKPVPVKFAEMRDFEGDGYADELYMLFEKKLRTKDLLDSFVVEWGYKSETRSFITKADISTGKIIPSDDSWTIKDSLGLPYEIMIDSVVDTKVDTFSIVTIKIKPGNAFSLGATSGPYEGLGHVTPRLGPEGGFFDKFYNVNDKCAPIVLKATWKSAESSDRDVLEVMLSEPMDTVSGQPFYFERLRDGKSGTYYSPISNPSITANKSSDRSYTLIYSHDAPEAFWLSDSIRLIPDETISHLRDKQGLFAGVATPWAPIVGKITKAKFKVSVLNPLSTVNKVNAYGGQKLAPDENFRLSLKTKNDETLVVASGDRKLRPVVSTPIANYEHAGPVFKIEIVMPEVLEKTELGEPKREYEVALAADFYNTTGTYANSTTFKFNPMDYVDFISTAESSLTFYLEWCVPGDAPISAEGKKIATGSYIAKFGAKAKGKYAAKIPSKDDNTKAFNANESITKTFGFRRIKN